MGLWLFAGLESQARTIKRTGSYCIWAFGLLENFNGRVEICLPGRRNKVVESDELRERQKRERKRERERERDSKAIM